MATLSNTIHQTRNCMLLACEKAEMDKDIIKSFQRVMTAMEEGLRYHHGDIELNELGGVTQHHVLNGLTALAFQIEGEEDGK